MYRYRYINKHEQYGRTSYTLLLQDIEAGMPDIRIEKEFGMLSKDIDDEVLFQEAAKEIAAGIQAYSDYLASLPITDSTGDQ